MQSSSALIEQIDFDTAEEFFHALMPTSRIWAGTKLDDYVFRGHADATWALLPTALRSPLDANWPQRFRELTALRQFWSEADRQGLAIAGDDRETREFWISSVAPGLVGARMLKAAGREDWAAQNRTWPPPELWQALALAQHYGIETRLLDWTRLPTIAAYFAALRATESLELGGHSEQIAVWACLDSVLNVARWLEPPQQFVHMVVVPRAGNPNLHAQHGMFTLVTPHGTGGDPPDHDPVDCTPLDEAVCRTLAASRQSNGNVVTQIALEVDRPMKRLTMPTKHAPKLLHLLHMLGISGGTLLAGFSGAAQGAKEHSLRRRTLN